MSKAPQDNSVEQRRRLLKGALGASTVVTLGYGGSAAAASMSCVAKEWEVGNGPPAGTMQFTQTPPQPTTMGSNWGWLRVDVKRYTDGSTEFDGFEVGYNIYKTTEPGVALTGAEPTSPQPEDYPKDGWVLAYFNDSGELIGTYPTKDVAAPGATPATGSCLASVNPGAVGNFTFGG